MKVLAISGSPRIGGNSETLCDRFLEGAKEAGHDIEKINLSQKKISPCFACSSCENTGVCVQKDDMAEMLKKVIAADVIILSTPVYFYSVSAQMKLFIDRCFSEFRQIKDKDFYFIISAAASDHEAMSPVIGTLKGYTVCLPGAQVKGIIYGTGAWEKGDILRMPVIDEAYEAGKSIKRRGK
ncbi:flavodoxin family protein [Clostridium butyricum]|uniref:flavodoxin family protein n=1 Tax=Clostridium butyricum TaxID=1492 RepID=UPI002ABD2333|nr:flavodoxin family protein [Clostridium butyricum]